jgi:methyltransferase
MGLSVYLFLSLLAAVGLLRLVELRISRRHQERMVANGAVRVPEPHFKWMVALHTGVLVGAAVEVVALRRPFLPLLGTVMFALFLGSNLVRLWVILALGDLWNVQVMDSTRIGVVTTGPFRYVRHPNYGAVILEMVSLPLIHTAWITAVVTAVAHPWVLSKRLQAEESVLMANPEYRAAMGHKPRFLPGLF